MDKLHPQAALLLGYVDKQLSPEEITEAEALLASDPEAVAFVETLGASQLPFAESFDFLLEDTDSEVEKELSENKLPHLESIETKKQIWQWPASIAASLMIGLVVGYGIFSTTSKSNNQDLNWVTEVANYQMLYVRETVLPSPAISVSEHLALQKTLGSALRGELNIPDLSEQKLAFKRGQILEIDGKALVQLVYLPDSGLPIALCILRNGVDDSLPKSGESRGQPFVEWSKNGLSYVIIGKVDKNKIEAAALTAIAQL